ncbi:DUF2188 domain-containing protein [Mesorhizobium sp. B4-1-3]|nr:DUF2188 domain-containing protein [Mesorhizobium sp. B4-1-3]
MAAIKAANETALHGFEAEVLIQGIDGKWRTEWSGDERTFRLSLDRR